MNLRKWNALSQRNKVGLFRILQKILQNLCIYVKRHNPFELHRADSDLNLKSIRRFCHEYRRLLFFRYI